jgi:uncharacterized protein Usg
MSNSTLLFGHSLGQSSASTSASSVPNSAFLRQLAGYGLTTANVFYHRPDHPAVLQNYIWQDYDVAPDFPVLKSFLEFWENTLSGKLHSVQISHSRLIKPAEYRAVNGLVTLH